MSESVPVNPDILRWARKTAGFSIDDVVRKLKRKLVTSETIKNWEKGEESPTYPQLESLAYVIYKRPLALFFFPEPPQEETPKQSFRTLPEFEISRISPRMRYMIRQARALQINLAELNEDVNPASQQILRDSQFEPSVAVNKMAATVREYLNIDLATQVLWRDTDIAFKKWRHALERSGVFVFKDAFKDDTFSGFCLYDKQFPIIYVNNSKPDTRQIFTLFHELAHLLLGTGGVDTRLDKYIDLLKGNDKKIEMLCNQFAAEFLVPKRDFDQQIVRLHTNDESIEQLALRYSVSREVILRKLLDRHIVSKEYYVRKIEQWAVPPPKKSGKGGGNANMTKGVYLGYNYIGLAYRRFYQSKISEQQLANYLGIKVRRIPKMESLLLAQEAQR